MAQNKLNASFIFLFVALIMSAAPIAQAQFDLLLNINGSIFCSLDGRPGVLDGVAIPPFHNALVQLQCGRNVVTSATTNQNGVFIMTFDSLPDILPSLLSNCRIIVNTPLSNCNANLPSVGGLVSRGFIGNIFNLVPGVLDYVPTIYQLDITTVRSSSISVMFKDEEPAFIDEMNKDLFQ